LMMLGVEKVSGVARVYCGASCRSFISLSR